MAPGGTAQDHEDGLSELHGALHIEDVDSLEGACVGRWLGV